mmetsp:Transcript_23487/g.67484  ORF Transcript_23487/g.67484 Transcript_23487/m.67484 type:complete len:129 (-) Transcript_23487:117-503(-)
MVWVLFGALLRGVTDTGGREYQSIEWQANGRHRSLHPVSDGSARTRPCCGPWWFAQLSTHMCVVCLCPLIPSAIEPHKSHPTSGSSTLHTLHTLWLCNGPTCVLFFKKCPLPPPIVDRHMSVPLVKRG